MCACMHVSCASTTCTRISLLPPSTPNAAGKENSLEINTHSVCKLLSNPQHHNNSILNETNLMCI